MELFVTRQLFVGGFPLAAVQRRFEMNTRGFHGDVFSRGWGDFFPVKRARTGADQEVIARSNQKGITSLDQRARQGLDQEAISSLDLTLRNLKPSGLNKHYAWNLPGRYNNVNL